MRVYEDVDAARARLGELIAEASRIVVFTGAGISTESGIPDFRSPGGIWSKIKPILFDEFVASEETRLEDWRRRFRMAREFAEASPNAGHRAVAALLGSGRTGAVITQNIDRLHQRAGAHDGAVVELHGNAFGAACLDCGLETTLAAAEQTIAETGRAPRCTACGGLVKSTIISFGQPMPADAMRRAQAEARDCDLLLVIGSSLVVYPAAGIPLIAKQAGARFAILNREATELDPLADVVLRGGIGEVLGPFALG
jgi:NAD-dependent deacetylase